MNLLECMPRFSRGIFVSVKRISFYFFLYIGLYLLRTPTFNMKKIYTLTLLLLIIVSGNAQTDPNTAFAHRAFPQEKINAEIKKAFEHESAATVLNAVKQDSKSNAGQAMSKIDEVKKKN